MNHIVAYPDIVGNQKPQQIALQEITAAPRQQGIKPHFSEGAAIGVEHLCKTEGFKLRDARQRLLHLAPVAIGQRNGDRRSEDHCGIAQQRHLLAQFTAELQPRKGAGCQDHRRKDDKPRRP